MGRLVGIDCALVGVGQGGGRSGGEVGCAELGRLCWAGLGIGAV